MNHWYFRKNNAEKTGPYSLLQIKTKAKKNKTAEAMLDGVFNWKSVLDIPELELNELKKESFVSKTKRHNENQLQSSPSSTLSALQNSMPLQRVRENESEGIDYRIFGSEMQFVEIELDPSESVIAEAGGMMYKDASIEMETLFGDGSEKKNTGFMSLLAGAGRRLITGESLFTTVFTHKGLRGKAHVSFAAPYPGNIVPFQMNQFNGTIICQKDAFLCASKGISIGIHFSKKIMTGLFGGEGFILQKLTATSDDDYAMSFIHAGGTIIEKTLAPGECLEIDTGCLVAMTDTIDFDIRYVGGIKSAFFGGEGLFFGTLTARSREGKVWLQSLPFSRLAGRILATAKGNFRASEGGVRTFR
jgi:uncharacterized protein (TIGR00266 family)